LHFESQIERARKAVFRLLDTSSLLRSFTKSGTNLEPRSIKIRDTLFGALHPPLAVVSCACECAPVTDESKLIPARQAAAMLGVSVDTVRRAVQDGRLPAVRLRERGWLRFRRADLEELISGGR
jgi:excisionase family DNA binding protein